MRPVQLIEGEKVVEYPLVQAMLTKRYTERALSFIERSKDKPFFLYFPQAMPHKPLAASEEFYKKSGAGLDGTLCWNWIGVSDRFSEAQTTRNYEKTLVIFTSQNLPRYGGSTGGLSRHEEQQLGRRTEGSIDCSLARQDPGRRCQ